VGAVDIYFTTTKQETKLLRTYGFYVGVILFTMYNAFVSWNMQFKVHDHQKEINKFNLIIM
jgi:hypothetical protein